MTLYFPMSMKRGSSQLMMGAPPDLKGHCIEFGVVRIDSAIMV